jgi:hypothetical protein
MGPGVQVNPIIPVTRSNTSSAGAFHCSSEVHAGMTARQASASQFLDTFKVLSVTSKDTAAVNSTALHT